MNAELRRLHSPDALDLERFAPATPECFGILVQAMIGPRGRPGEEAFDLVLCTPSWLGEQLLRDNCLWLQDHLLVTKFDYRTLVAAVEGICAQVAGDTWTEVALKLNRFARWEFADYRESGSSGT